MQEKGAGYSHAKFVKKLTTKRSDSRRFFAKTSSRDLIWLVNASKMAEQSSGFRRDAGTVSSKKKISTGIMGKTSQPDIEKAHW